MKEKESPQPDTIAVLGDGAWATTLAIYLTKKKEHRVLLWSPFPAHIETMRARRENPYYLPGVPLPRRLTLTSDWNEAMAHTACVVVAIPSRYVEAVRKPFASRHDHRNRIVVSVVKGFNPHNFERISVLLRRLLCPRQVAVLSGPNIAQEVVRGVPSSAVIACTHRATADRLQRLFNSDTFRIYTNTDVTGVELAGALKNIIAIACGICDGLGFGTNTKAALIARALKEITRFGMHFGGRKQTFLGLAGIGDLMTTCFSPQSRNRRLGEALGRGCSLQEALNDIRSEVEGVPTTETVRMLARRHHIPMPITEEVHQVLFKNRAPCAAVASLMMRPPKPENW